MKDLNDLDVSKKWKSRFQLIQDIGGKEIYSPFKLQATPEFKSLPLTKRMSMNFSCLSFLFSFFWYFAKGMWGKGFVILSFASLYSAILLVIERLANIQIIPVLFWVPVSAICGLLGVFDYYRYKIEDERMWKGAFFGGGFDNKASIALFLISALSVNVAAALYSEGAFSQNGPVIVENQTEIKETIQGVDNTHDQQNLLRDIVWSVWNSGDTKYTFTADNDKLVLHVNNEIYPLTITNIDADNLIVSTIIDGKNIPFTIRQVWDENNDSFNLSVSINDNTPVDLAFIREIDPATLKKTPSKVSQSIIDAAINDYRSKYDNAQYKTYSELKDLDSDGKYEILLSDSNICGSGGCMYDIYSYSNGNACYIGVQSDPLVSIKGPINCQSSLKNQS